MSISHVLWRTVIGRLRTAARAPCADAAPAVLARFGRVVVVYAVTAGEDCRRSFVVGASPCGDKGERHWREGGQEGSEEAEEAIVGTLGVWVSVWGDVGVALGEMVSGSFIIGITVDWAVAAGFLGWPAGEQSGSWCTEDDVAVLLSHTSRVLAALALST